MFPHNWASLVAQLVKNLPTMRERPWVRSMGWEDTLEKGILEIPTPVFLPGESHGQEHRGLQSMVSQKC